MTKAQLTLREYPGAAAEVGATVTFKKHSDGSTITTDTTDANGQAQYEANGSPGPWYWESVVGSTTRRGSSKSYGGGGAFSAYELVYALRIMGDGVIDGYLNELAVTYDGAGLDLDINTGAALGAGVIANFPSVTDLTSVGTRDATHPKACYCVVEIAPPGQSDEGRSEIKAVCGTAAASPVLPTLTNDETLRQVALATYTLPNTGSTTLTNLADVRAFVLDPDGQNPEAVQSAVVRRSDPTAEITTTSTSGVDVTGLTSTLTLTSGVVYDIEVRGYLLCKSSSSGQTVSIAPYGNGSAAIASYVSGNHTDYAALGNVHTIAGVTGSGAAIAVGLSWKVSGGTATANVGYVLAKAVPR
jgi:hypothetical protein